MNNSFPESSTAATGRNDSPASGSFREANLQRRLSGGESEELSVATRPRLCQNLKGARLIARTSHAKPVNGSKSSSITHLIRYQTCRRTKISHAVRSRGGFDTVWTRCRRRAFRKAVVQRANRPCRKQVLERCSLSEWLGAERINTTASTFRTEVGDASHAPFEELGSRNNRPSRRG